MIPHNRVITTKEDIEAVSRVVASGQLAQGPEVKALEHEMCEYTGRKYAVAVASGLSALRLSMLCWKDRTPIIPAYSCVALTNAAYSWSDKIGIADVLPGEWTIDPDDLGPDASESTVVAVNTFGVPADVSRIIKTGAVVIEDCTHGFRHYGRNLAFAQVCSFYATKLIGGAEGGIILTDGSNFAEKVRNYRDYGDKPASGLRLNDKMSDVHAVLVRSKLKRLPLLIEERAELAALYLKELNPVWGEIDIPFEGERTWYRFVIETPDAEIYLRRLEQMNIQGERPVWDWMRCDKGKEPVAYSAHQRLVSLPLYPGLSRNEVGYIARCVREIAREMKEAA